MGTKKSPIYLDHNATTPVDERVLALMLPFFRENFGNSMSLSHELGWTADSAVEGSRDLVSRLLNASRLDFTWTSGATEANNWALRGLVEKIRRDEGPTAQIHILASPLEHASILNTLSYLQEFHAVEVEWLPVTIEGLVPALAIENLLKPHTRLVVCMWAQNEVGSINPMREIGELCRRREVYLMTDATQAVGKIPVDLSVVHVDLMSFSAHKLYGPKGVGFLYHRKKDPAVALTPLLYGGGHERGDRSGTLNTPGVVGQAQALKIAIEEQRTEALRILDLRDCLWQGLRETYPDLILNGPALPARRDFEREDFELSSLRRLPGNLNISFNREKVPPHLPGLAISRGSACDTGKTSTSHVLAALGLSPEQAAKTLRFGLGRGTDLQEIRQTLEIIRQHIKT